MTKFDLDQASIYTLSLCRGHSWRVRLAKQETLTPPGHLVSPLVCRGPWMSTVVLYCWCHSDSASVLLYFTFNSSCQSLLQTSIQICESIAKKTPENEIWIKPYNSGKCNIYGRSIVEKSWTLYVTLHMEACDKVSFGYKPVYDKRGLMTWRHFNEKGTLWPLWRHCRLFLYLHQV